MQTVLPLWLSHYQRQHLSGDSIAALIVTVMLIPQSIAYALLAGLPPHMGLYASILPLLAYAWLGSSMTLAVGPVAIIALMTATAISPLAQVGSDSYASFAMILALLSGSMLMLLGWLKLGRLAHLLSHPVMSGFIIGSALLIALGQLSSMLVLPIRTNTLPTLVFDLYQHSNLFNQANTLLGISTLAVLLLLRQYTQPLLIRCGVSAFYADIISKLSPIMVIALASYLTYALQWRTLHHVQVVGAITTKLPSLQWVFPNLQQTTQLVISAFFISLVGFIESVSVANALAKVRLQKIDSNAELKGLGLANIVAGCSGGFPVAGGLSRSAVNFSAGAHTPLAGVLSAALLLVITLTAGNSLAYLPKAVLAATIIVAVTSLIDFKPMQRAWVYDKTDAMALLVTLAGVLLAGVEIGIMLGVVVSLAVLVWHTSNPHMAIVGRVGNSEHFRNVQRANVRTYQSLLIIRIDESMYFANAEAIANFISDAATTNNHIRQVIVIMSAVNHIDSSALEVLTAMEALLRSHNIQLHLTEVKGPVMDKLATTDFAQHMRPYIWLSTDLAVAHCLQ